MFKRENCRFVFIANKHLENHKKLGLVVDLRCIAYSVVCITLAIEGTVWVLPICLTLNKDGCSGRHLRITWISDQ